MGLLTRLRAAAHAFTRAAANDWQQPGGWTITNGRDIASLEYTGTQVRTAWQRHPVVQACARLVADHVAAVPLEVYEEGPDGPVLLPEHPLQLLLNQPSPSMSAFRHRGMTALQLLFFGNAFWHEVRGPAGGQRGFGLPQRLDLLLPDLIRFAWFSEAEAMIAKWDWATEGTGAQVSALATDVVHFADYGAESTLIGYPRAAAALGDITADMDASRYVREVLKNDGSPTMIFHMAEFAGQDVLNQANAVWQAKRANRGNAGMAAFLPGTVKAEQMGFSLADLEFPDLRRISREDICSVFGVDPRMVGIASAAKDSGLSGEQYREARRRLIAQAVSPLMFLIEGQINHWLAPEYGLVKVRFSPAVLTEMTENTTETSTRALAEYTQGARTWEETRVILGLPANADPTHYLVAPGSFRTVALATQMAAKEPAPPAPFGGFGGFGGGGGGGSGGSEPATPPVPAAPEPKALGAPETRTGLTPEQRVAEWRSFDARARGEEDAFARAALAQMDTDRALVGRVLAEHGKRADPAGLTDAEVRMLLAAIDELFRPNGESWLGWASRFGPLELSLGLRTAEALDGRLGLNLATGISPAFRAALEARVGRLASYVGEATARQISDAILAGRAQGLSVPQVGELISDTVFGGLQPGRAATIARTETVGTMNEAEWRAAQASATAVSKEWLTQQDDRVRDSHLMLDGVQLPLSGVYSNGLMYPHDPAGDAGEVVNCRCVLFYSAEKAEG